MGQEKGYSPFPHGKAYQSSPGKKHLFLNVYYTKQIPETCAWDLATQRTYYAWDVFLAHKDSSFLGKWLWCPDLSPEKANESLQNAGPLGSKSFTQDWAIGQPELNWVNQVLLCGKSEFSIKCLLGRSLCSWIMLGVILKKGSLCCLVPEITRATLLSSLLKFYLFSSSWNSVIYSTILPLHSFSCLSRSRGGFY